MIEVCITPQDGWFTGTDRTLHFGPILDESGAALDVSTWDWRWAMRAVLNTRRSPYEGVNQGASELAAKSSGLGISVVGTHDPDSSKSTQRVQVLLDAIDTAALASGLYVHALRREDPGQEGISAHGTIWWSTPPTR